LAQGKGSDQSDNAADQQQPTEQDGHGKTGDHRHGNREQSQHD
jgi:hypothetical protein